MEIFDIDKLYLTVFGTVAAPFPLAKKRTYGKVIADDFEEDDVKANPAPIGEDELADESFNYINSLGGRYRLPVKIGATDNVQDQYQLPNEPIISIDGMKDVKITNIRRPKGRGSVKEERALGDYKIKIIGFCINEDSNQYPTDQVRQIRDLWETQGVLYITNHLTRIFGITKISMIPPFSFPRHPELPVRVQPYSFTALSDFDFEDYQQILQAG